MILYTLKNVHKTHPGEERSSSYQVLISCLVENHRITQSQGPGNALQESYHDHPASSFLLSQETIVSIRVLFGSCIGVIRFPLSDFVFVDKGFEDG